MAKAKPIPIAITNSVAHTAQQTLRIRHVALSAIGNINSDFAKFEYQNQVELWQTWPGRQAVPNTPLLSYCRNTLRAKWLFKGAGAELLVYYANAASLWLRTSLCLPHIWVLSELSGIITNKAQKILHEFAWPAHKAKQVTSWRADGRRNGLCKYAENRQHEEEERNIGREGGGCGVHEAHNSTRAQSVELTIGI